MPSCGVRCASSSARGRSARGAPRSDPAIGWLYESVELVEREPDINTIQMIWNVLEQHPGSAMIEAARRHAPNCCFNVRVTHASGMLEGKYTVDTVFPENDHRRHRPRSWLVNGVQKVKTLDFLAREMTLGQAALKWLLAEPLVVTTLPNVYDDEQLAEFAAASDKPDLTRRAARARDGAGRDELRCRGRSDELQGRDDARARCEPGSAGRAQPDRPAGAAERRGARELMLNLWHDLPCGQNPPEIVTAVIEIPSGSRNKYELDKASGMLKLDRVLFSAVHYPGRLRLHPAHAARGRRSARRARDGEGADLPRMPDRRAPDRRAQDARPRRAGRQDPQRAGARPVSAGVLRHRRHPAAHAEGGRALLPHLQGPRGEARRDQGLGEERRGDARHLGVDVALRRDVRRAKAMPV